MLAVESYKPAISDHLPLGCYGLILYLPELPVESFALQQFMLRAALSDAARLHHQNLIRSLQPDQPMRDHQRCSPLHQVMDGAQHFMLGTSIEVGGWFVENHGGSVFENGAR